jgi:transcriptional regulator with XRE-family HTH domain
MAHPAYLREKARQLRTSKRLTIDELADRLALPRTTIYYWVKDLPIEGSGPGGGLPTHAQRLGTRAMQRKYELRRTQACEEGERQFASLSTEAFFREFVCLYMAEGCKRNRNTVSIANSDPAIIAMSQVWRTKISMS